MEGASQLRCDAPREEFVWSTRNPDWRKNVHDAFRRNNDDSATYSAFVNYLVHNDLGGKALPFVIEGLYGSDNADGPPRLKWKMAGFNASPQGEECLTVHKLAGGTMNLASFRR